MNAPLYEIGRIGEGGSLAVALVIGVAFGFFLERGGMGSGRKLAGQFLLTDLTVFKVMFSAILTAMLGLFWLSYAGMVELSLVFVPETWLLPQLAGGVVFGIGFAMSSLCPGTSCVSAATGRGDGIAAVLGMLCGVVLFAELFPLIATFYERTPRGALTLPAITGLSHGAWVAIIVTVALAGFAGAEWIERRRAA